MLCYNMKNNIKECNICLASKIVEYKLYNNLQYLFIFIDYYKDLIMNFNPSLSIKTDFK